jgi:hypothetical protein
MIKKASAPDSRSANLLPRNGEGREKSSHLSADLNRGELSTGVTQLFGLLKCFFLAEDLRCRKFSADGARPVPIHKSTPGTSSDLAYLQLAACLIHLRRLRVREDRSQGSFSYPCIIVFSTVWCNKSESPPPFFLVKTDQTDQSKLLKFYANQWYYQL